MDASYQEVSITDAYLPHFTCAAGDPVAISMHVASDTVIALSYLAIPTALVWTSWRYRIKDVELRWVLIHAALFILSCSTTHLAEIWVWWVPTYRATGCIKGLCAIVSATFVWRAWRYLKAHPLKLDL